ncbi:PIN domain protein [uncultured archaeon]|nr:PIN domain protein [uncultured archaeon]
MKIILDTNFLIYCAREKLDYMEEIAEMINEGYDLVVPLQVIRELQQLRADKWKKVSGKDKNAADLALQIIDAKKIKKVEATGKTVDEAIVNLSREDAKNIVCTLDREMRFTLGRVILVSKGKKLILTK